MGLVPMPGCPLGTSRKQSRNMRSCWVWNKCARPWTPSLANNLPLLLSEAKETTSQVSCTCCSEPKDQPLGAQRPQEKNQQGAKGSSPHSRDNRHGPHPPARAAPGSTTNLPSHKTCHPPSGQIAALPQATSLAAVPRQDLFTLQSPSCFLASASPPDIPSEAQTCLSFFQDCSLHTLLALLHIPLLQEVYRDFPLPCCWVLNPCPTPSRAR